MERFSAVRFMERVRRAYRPGLPKARDQRPARLGDMRDGRCVDQAVHVEGLIPLRYDRAGFYARVARTFADQLKLATAHFRLGLLVSQKARGRHVRQSKDRLLTAVIDRRQTDLCVAVRLSAIGCRRRETT